MTNPEYQVRWATGEVEHHGTLAAAEADVMRRTDNPDAPDDALFPAAIWEVGRDGGTADRLIREFPIPD